VIKRVIHFVTRINAEASGPANSVPNLAAFAQSSSSKKIHHVLVTLDNEKQNDIHSSQINLGSIDLAHNVTLSFRLFYFALKLFFSRDNLRVHIIHVHGAWGLVNFVGPILARFTSIPLFISPRGSLSKWAIKSGSPFKKIIWPIQRYLFGFAQIFHATSEAEYKDIKRFFPAIHCVIIPNGLNIELIQQHLARLDEEGAGNTLRKQIIFLSRIHPKKGIMELLEAWGLVNYHFPDWYLKIYGEGEPNFSSRVLALVDQLPNCSFEGPVFGLEKYRILRNANLMILPTYSENFGMVIAESLACGTPVLVGKESPWHEVQDRFGWLCDPSDDSLPHILTDALKMSETTLRSMGMAGRDYVFEKYDWTNIGRQFHNQIYLDLIK